ncbi:hypothetical protein BOX15_Mlig008722g1 [Macrostomum lignano]|uniref:Protein kinase domain-containing protein n=1 Tax=Macrostomum lignano TaxID=282301 RepID=A0A267DWH0_9PLAT|nr:hypothetical protein BOX15_Mlig008722g1 [Macrostomum lignano]
MSSSDHRLFYGSGGLLSSMSTANSSDNANQFYAQSRSATGQSQTQYASNSGATAAAALGVRMHGMGMTPQHSRSLITGQHAISAAATAAANRSQTASLVAGTSFYDANNLDEVKKMQSAGKLTSPSWYAQLPAGEFSQFTERGDGVTYMDAELRRSLLSRIHFALIVPDAQLSATLPPALLHYEQLAPLETQLKRSGTFGLPSLCYKAFNGKDQTWVMLRRFVGVGQMQARLVGQQLESLRKLEHPHLVPVRHVFATDAFGDDSVCLVTDFFPGSTTLLSSHCSDPLKVNGFNSPFNIDGQARPISSIKSRSQSHVQSEAIVWHMLLQLASAVRACHARHSRAVRLLDPSKIIIDVEASRAGQQQRPRLRVNCLGAREILGAIGASFSDPAQAEEELVKAKQQDLVDLGKLLLVLSCGTTVALQDLNTSIELITRAYSKDLASVIRQLIYGLSRSIYDVMPAIGARFFDHLCESQQRVDFLEAQLTKQLENGRLFRLASKLNTVCERELPADPAWAETGDRYMLKLFRDFVFHQTDPSVAYPWIDLAHIVSCLQRLDMGSQQRVCLVSRDSQNIMLVTYAELKRWLDDSCVELIKQMEDGMAQQQQQPPGYYGDNSAVAAAAAAAAAAVASEYPSATALYQGGDV